MGGEVDGLLGGAALPVHRGGRDRFGKAGGKDGPPRGVDRLLADLGHASADHVIDRAGIDTGAVDQAAQRVREQVDGVHGGKRAAGLALADRSSDCVDDDCVAHEVSP